MKKLLLSALFLCCMATSFAQFSGSGSGTANDPYLILNPIHLNQIRNFNNTRNVYFKLMADIDLTEFIADEYPKGGWLPIPSFGGTLDGNGKTVSGLVIDRPNEDNVGLFAKCEGTIKDLNLKADVKGRNNTGAFAGDGSYLCEISNCKLDGVVVGNNYVGGFCGRYGSFSNCITTANVMATGDYIGGLCGGGSFQNCIATGITVSGHDHVGGLCGDGSSNHSSFIGNVYGNNYVGGVSGGELLNGVYLDTSYALGKIIATGDYVGGVIGCLHSNSAHVRNCYFSGSIIGHNNVGGVVGYGPGSCYVDKSYAMSTVSGNESVGGLIGVGYYHLTTGSVANNPKINADKSSVGRVIGNGSTSTSTNNKAYNRMVLMEGGVPKEAEENTGRDGMGVSATTLKLKATYVAMGWDFYDIWEIQETECYPYFKWQTAPPVLTSKLVSQATTISGKCVDGATVYLEIDGKETVSTRGIGNQWSFTVSPLQAGNQVRICAKTEDKQQSYYLMETVAYAGSGTEAAPWQVYTAADLANISGEGYYKLMNDIDLTAWIAANNPTKGWTPIGGGGNAMTQLDGAGQKVSGLWTATTADYTALFYRLANATIKNLTVETAEGKQVKGGSCTAIIVGQGTNMTLEDCTVKGRFSGSTTVGGLIGRMNGGSITGCKADVNGEATADKAYIGGLAGELDGVVSRSHTGGTLTASGKTSYVGGLAGLLRGSITDSYSKAEINSAYCAAGVVGYSYGLIERCYAFGDLYSKNYGAGIVGYNDGAKAITRHCVAMNNKIDVTYESQQVGQGGGYGQRIVGGIKNGAPAPEMDNYALNTMQVSLNDVPQKVYDDIMNGTAKTLTELTAKTTYEAIGWDFNTVWKIQEGVSYPYLDEVELKPEEPVVVTVVNKTREYGDANPEFTFTIEGGELKGTPVITCEATASSPVGGYPIVISAGSVTNTKVTFVNGTLTVTKAPLTVKVEDAERYYGEENPEFTITYSGWKLNENESVLTAKPQATTTATVSSPVGEYPITASGGVANNYELSYQNGTLTVLPIVTVTAVNCKREYGDANPEFTFTVEGGELNGTPVITCAATPSSPAGCYPIVISAGSVTNPKVNFINGTLTVTKASLTVKVENAEREYGDPNPEFTVTYSGWKLNDNESVLTAKPRATTTAEISSPVEKYPIVVSGGSATNYELYYQNDSLTIYKAPIFGKVNDVTRERYQPSPEFTITWSGFKLNDDESALKISSIGFKTDATEDSPEGEYRVWCNMMSGYSKINYDVSLSQIQDGVLTVIAPSGIGEVAVDADHPADVYTIQGNKVRSKATTLKGLPKGVYIVNGKKVTVK